MSLIANNKLDPHMVQGQNQIHATLVEGKHSHHCTNLLGADTTYIFGNYLDHYMSDAYYA